MDKLLTHEQHFLLSKIKWLNELASYTRLATHRNIWSGCYDVWSCERDRIDAAELPLKHMNDAINNNWIYSDEQQYGKYILEIWHLTDLGKNILEGHCEKC